MTNGGRGRCNGLGSHLAFGKPVVGTGEVGNRLGQQQVDHLEGLVEAVEPLTQRREVDAVCLVLLLIPPGAKTQLEAAARDHIDRRRHVCQHRRVAIRVPGDHHPEPQALGHRRHRSEDRPPLHAGPGGIAGDRHEVVEGPCAVEDVRLIGLDPHIPHRLPGRVHR